ncbi:cytosolic long-chain acyl-CoA thioester hydrolase family protein [Jejuia pallidilutea]|uniref:Cytosolic long-chain acyl-CoA thioester hydrolase family protein n=1 Tax=Jejuia pallidilutea TaxID=504487 RepID=A0A090X0N8_9FLAO|nr:cytosolic long-chain acyl-CoA thioester hydrolase family protein [Jejuia pallidilutea]
MQLENQKVVTKYISEIDFKSSAKQGDVIEIGIDAIKFGKASLTLCCEVRNMRTRETIITISNIVMVNIGPDGKVLPHGKTKVEYVKDRL